MAGEIASAFVRVRPNTAGFKPELERGVKGAFAGVGRIAAQAGIAYGGFKFFEAAIKDAAEEQRALDALEQSVKSVGASWMVHGQTLKQVLNQMEIATGTELPELAQGFLRLVTSTKDSAKALTDLHRAQDIAIARHMGLAQASVILARAEGGSDTALRRLGIIIPKLTPHYDALTAKVKTAEAAGATFTKAEKLVIQAHLDAAKVIDARGSKTRILTEIDKRFGGQTERYAKTAAGQWARFHVSVRNVLEDIGTGLLPTLSHAAGGLQDFIEHTRKSGEYANLFADSGDTLKTVLRGVGEIAHAIGPPLSIAVKGAAKLADAIGGGTIIAAVVGYKALGLVVKIAAGAEALFAGATAKATIATTENTVATEANAAAAAKISPRLTMLGSPAVLGAIAAATGALWLLHKAEKAANDEADANDAVATAAANARTFYARRVTKHLREGVDAAKAQRLAVEELIVAHKRDADIGGPDVVSPKAARIGRQVEAAERAANEFGPKISAAMKKSYLREQNDMKKQGHKTGVNIAAGIAEGVTDAEARALYRRAVTQVSGAELGYPMIQGLVDAIRARSPELANQLGTSVADAVTSARLSIRDAFESAAGNLDTLGADAASRIGSVLDQRLTVQMRRIENGLDMRIRRMQDKLSALQAVRERRTLREDITAAGVGAAGLHRDAGESAADFQQRRVEAAKRISDANVALRNFETEQTIGALQKRSERTKEHLQKQNELAKEASARNIADLTDSFNRGAITQEQLVHGIAAQMRKQGAGYREAGRLLGSAFAHGFSAEVSALAKQATIIGKLPHLPGVTGVEPQLVRPIDAVRAAIVSVAEAQAQRDQSALEEQRKQTALLKKVHTAQLKAAGRTKAKDFVDDLTTGSKR